MHHITSRWLLLWIFSVCGLVAFTRQDSQWDQQEQQELQFPDIRDKVKPAFVKPGKQRSRNQQSERPNIVFIITDDQDSELGSLNFMPKTMKHLRDAGATFPNAFVTTPMCCPSRSSMLTGMYVHNHNTYTNNDNCSSPQWRQTHELKNFGTYLYDAGYRTGYFGKYLNDYTGAYIPPGWTEWMGLIRNTRFYNYTVNHNMTKIKHEDDYSKDYLTDLIANSSIKFFQESKQWFPQKPVAMVLSMPAPHGPEDAAPQYQDKFFDVRTHRTPSWNFAPNPDKQWLLQYTQKMLPVQIAFTDLLHVKRLQTLQSVDDAVERVTQMLESLGELDNTYIVYSSDHGYHLGQYGLVKGKAMPYEFDIKVPFLMRGPRVPQNIRIPNIVLNLDLAPTFLDIAGVPIPDHMDGSSVLKLFDGPDEIKSDEIRKKRVWRDTFLVERGKLTQRKLKVQEKLEAQYNRLLLTKDQRLEDECRKPQYQPPCNVNQEWECRRNEHEKLRIYKCRHNEVPAVETPHCQCPTKDHKIHLREKERQLNFLKKNVNQPKKIHQPRFIKRRTRRGKRHLRHASTRDRDDDLAGIVPHFWTPVNLESDDVSIPCRLTLNSTIFCERYVYMDADQWELQKNRTEHIIKAYKDRITQLKDIRKHLLESRPTSPSVEELEQREVVTVEDNSVSGRKTSTVADEAVTSSTPGSNILTEVELTVEDKMEEEDLDQEETFEGEEGGEVGEVEEEEDGREVHTEKMTSEEIGSSGIDDNEQTTECICDENSNKKIKNKKLETLARHIEKQDERGLQRKLRLEKHRFDKSEAARYNSRRKHKRNRISFTGEPQEHPDCNSQDGNCPTDHSTVLPVEQGSLKQVNWDNINISLYSSRHDPNCHIDGLECSRMDNEHWKVAPFWTKGPFCICPNSNNNTYWCLRTVNDTHNFLYCEFITGFISFYDMTKDPYQLRNAVHDLSYELLHQLHNSLEKMKGCKGSRKCNLRSRIHEDEKPDWKQVRHNSKHDKLNHQYSDQSRLRRVSSKQG